MAKSIIITAQSLNLESSCLSCSKFFSCNDPHKSGAWSCSSFEPLESSHTDDLLTQAQLAIDLNSSALMEFGDDDEEDMAQQGEIEKMIADSLRDSRLLPTDLTVDDSHIPEAKNFYDFCYGSLGIKFTPHARQLWIALMLFAEVCPHCSDPKWYNDVEEVPVRYRGIDIPEHLTLLEYGVCPKCKRGRAEMHRKGDLNIFQELALCLGQRAGKSLLASALCSYHIHKLLKTVRPSEFYGLSSSTPLTHTYTGLQYKRAYALLWTPIRNTILDAPWFKVYHSFLTDEGNRLGEELVTIKDTFINWKRSRLIAAPVAPNVGTLRGDTRAGAAIDELGLFKFGSGAEDYVTISADEIHASLANALATVRTSASNMIRSGENNVQQGIMFNMSSPISVFDKIMTLVRSATNSRTMLGVRLPTWEINPAVTREDLQIYYDTNAVKAERDFGANPPLASSPFFEDKDKIASLFEGVKNRVTYKVVERTNKGGVIERGAVIVATNELPKMPPSILTMDAGVSNNSFSLSISIPVAKGVRRSQPRQGSSGYAVKRQGATPLAQARIKQNEMLQDQLRSVPLDLNSEQGENLCSKTLVTIEVMPPPNGRINFNQMLKNCIIPLLKPFNVQVVITDRWNSILLLDQLRDEEDVNTFQYSLRYKDFEAIKSYIEGGRVQCPSTETKPFDSILSFDQESYPYCFEGRPIDHLALQFLTVQDTGRTVDKGPNLTDDSFRSIALAVHYLKDIDFVTTYLSGASSIGRSQGGGLVASGSGELSTQSYNMTSNSNRALVAAPGGGGSSEGGNVFARTRK